jgi:hypothetical protein
VLQEFAGDWAGLVPMPSANKGLKRLQSDVDALQAKPVITQPSYPVRGPVPSCYRGYLGPWPIRYLNGSFTAVPLSCLGCHYRVDCSSWHLALQIVAATSNVQALNTWLWRSVYLLYSLLDRPSLRLGPPSCDNRNCTKSRRALAASPLSFPSTPFCPNPSPGFHREH